MSTKTGDALRIPVLADTGDSKSKLAELQKSLVKASEATEELIDSMEGLTDETKAALKAQLAEAKQAEAAAEAAAQAHKDAVADLDAKKIALREARLAVEESSGAEKKAAQEARKAASIALRDAELVAESKRQESAAALQASKDATEAYQTSSKKIVSDQKAAARQIEETYRRFGLVSEETGKKRIAAEREALEVLKKSGASANIVAAATEETNKRVTKIYKSMGVTAKRTFDEIARHASKQLKSIGDGMKSAGSSLSMKVTAPVTLGLGGILKWGRRFRVGHGQRPCAAPRHG